MTTKILVLASNPQGTEQLRLNPEIREIEDALERGKNREQFVLRWRSAVRVKDLQHWIRNSEARIVHFCGHGMGSQGLVLETSSGRQQLLDTQAIADLFKLFKNQVECVVLNACYSEVQAAEINKHINYVIGTKKEIRDDAAIFFSTGFYEALGDGETIERAYEFGRNRIQLEIYGSSNRERKLVPVYSEAESKWVELPQHEVIKLLITKSLNSIVEYSPSLTADKEAIIQLPFIARSPYKGLKRFNARDKDLFFGRERLTNKLIEAVNQSNLVLLLGASGSGKSSVVRAGLIPQIESLSETPYQCCLFTPNRDPFESFHRSLLNPEKDYGLSPSEIEFVLEDKSDTLTKTADLLKTTNPQWLIFIDQFEELFTICSKLETRRNFIQGIIHIAQDTNKSVKLILAMRSDFLEELSAYSQFAKIVEKNIHLVADMQTEELRQAIEQPAAQHGIVFESGLVNEIIHDVQGQAGSLPLLQYTLDLLWQEDDLSDRNRTLNIATYRQLGGVSGALQKHVNQIYQGLPPEEQLATKQILLRLVDVVGLEKSEVLKTAVSRRAYKSEFPEAQAKTVNLLVNKTLLVSDDLKQEGQSTVEIAHEALLTSWAELKDWITDARDTISLNNRLAEDANRWQGLRSENQEQANEELWSGSKLEKVIEFRKDGTFDVVLGGLSDIANEFIDASIDWRDRRIKEKLAAARKLLFGAVISIFLLSGLSIAAVSFAVKSNKQEKMQFARQLAITSKWIRNQRAKLHEPSVLLALESYKLSHDINEPSSEADSALRDGLNLLPNNIAAISHQDFVSHIKFSPNGNYLATASRDGTAKLVQVSTGTEITTISHQGSFPLIKFSPNGDYLATRSYDGAKLIQVSTGKEITTISHQGSIQAIKFSPKGEYLAIASTDGTAKLIQVSTGTAITTISYEDRVLDIKFSPNGDYLATLSSDNTAKLVQVSTGIEITTISHQD
ncbi:MAG: CHAT domain-containing protein, partial [Xenococcus sp. (in: cyanobacteria)]